MKPIDLRNLAGTTYRIDHDPAADDESGGRKDPWLLVIPCRKGHIYPHSGTHLALWWESREYLDRKHPCLTLYQDGDDEKTYLFSPDSLETVARLAGAKKRRKGRKLTDSERQKAIERLRPHWFSQKSHSTQR